MIEHRDCLDAMAAREAASVSLLIADPPFNIGFQYDRIDDRRSSEDYCDWCESWIAAAKRVIAPTGAIWICIGDEYAAELHVIAKKYFTPRSWVIWYYTFGQSLKRKFSRSHVHLLWLTADPREYVFNAREVRVASAREIVYRDQRAKKGGKTPDDTWILHENAMRGLMLQSEDTWLNSRVAGTFGERAGFHGCQMPEAVLARMIRSTSHAGDVVYDPFAGSGTTLAVAKKLGRRFAGSEISEDYTRQANDRISRIRPGDAVTGELDSAVKLLEKGNPR